MEESIHRTRRRFFSRVTHKSEKKGESCRLQQLTNVSFGVEASHQPRLTSVFLSRTTALERAHLSLTCSRTHGEYAREYRRNYLHAQNISIDNICSHECRHSSVARPEDAALCALAELWKNVIFAQVVIFTQNEFRRNFGVSLCHSILPYYQFYHLYHLDSGIRRLRDLSGRD